MLNTTHRNRKIDYHQNPNIAGVVFVAAGFVVLLVLAAVTMIDTSSTKSNDTHRQSIADSVYVMQAIATSVQDQIVVCDQIAKGCEDQNLSALLPILEQELASLKQQAANEKSVLSITNIPAFELFVLNVKQFAFDRNLQELQQDLGQDLINIQSVSEALSREHQHYKDAVQQQGITFLISMIVTACLCLVIGLVILSLRQAGKENTEQESNLLTTILQWDQAVMEQNIANPALHDKERKAYTKVLHAIQDIRKLQKRIDLYASLYNVIGYEIRDITNKVKGGVDVLTRDMADNERVMAYQISMAAQTLESLADNFNQLFNAGNRDGNDSVDIYDLMADVSVGLSSKVISKGFVLESYFDRNIPPMIFGNYINIFWFLLLQFSNEITLKGGKNVVLLMCAQSADHIDKVSICFDMVLSDHMDQGLESLKTMTWQRAGAHHISVDNVMDHLLQDMHQFQVERFQHDDMEKLRIVIEAAPQTYPTYDKPLIGKRILLCGDCVTQIDLIATMLEDYGADIHYAKTPNDIFKSIGSSTKYNGVLITDTIRGIWSVFAPFRRYETISAAMRSRHLSM